MKSKLQKFLIIGLLFLSTSFKCDQKVKTTKIYNYKIANCDFLETANKIVSDTLSIGKINSIEVPVSLKYCFGKLELSSDFLVSSNTTFKLEKQLVGPSIIRVEASSSKSSRLLDYIKDTIIIEGQ